MKTKIKKQKNGGASAVAETLNLSSPILFDETAYLMPELTFRRDLKPSRNLLSFFEQCHNYIYANDGLLNDKIFHEVVKLLLMKLWDERRNPTDRVLFGITAQEYKDLTHGASESFLLRLGKLFLDVRARYPQFLAEDKGISLRPLSLAFVVKQLQDISITESPRDAKGDAFQTFVYRHQRGGRGEYFTPYPIVQLAVDFINPQPNESVIDPACGSGGFLMEVVKHVEDISVNNKITQDEYVKKYVNGWEFNPDIAQAAVLRMLSFGGEGKEIVCKNSLENLNSNQSQFDVIVTNPPFGSKGKVEEIKILSQYELGKRWTKNGEGEWVPTEELQRSQAPDILFIELGIKLLKPNGRMAIVLPEGILQNVSVGYVRQWIKKHAVVEAVVSIPQEAFIPYGTGIKTSILFLRKLPVNGNGSCFMARVHKMGYDVKGKPIYKVNSVGTPIPGKNGEFVVDSDIEDVTRAYLNRHSLPKLAQNNDVFCVTKEDLNSRLDVEHYLPEDLALIRKLKKQGAERLGELAEVLTKTIGADFSGDQDIRYVAISDIDYRTLQIVSQQIMKAHEAPSRATYQIQDGDIITAVAGASTGTSKQATALVSKEEDGAICSNGLVVLRNIKGIDPLYLLGFMKTSVFHRQVRRLMTGHAIPAITSEDLENILIPIPSPKDQNRIARAVDELLALRRKASALSEQLDVAIEKII